MSRAQLQTTVGALSELNARVVFLGGASVGLWITDPTTRESRVTYDVDVVMEVTTLAGYADFEAQLRDRGFREGIERRPCRSRCPCPRCSDHPPRHALATPATGRGAPPPPRSDSRRGVSLGVDRLGDAEVHLGGRDL